MNALSFIDHSRSLTKWIPATPITLTGSEKPKDLDDVFWGIKRGTQHREQSKPSQTGSELEGALRTSSSSFKVLVSRVSMHLGLPWLEKLFSQIDSLLDIEEWDERDPVPAQETARTFIRMLLILKVSRKPGLGVSNSGNLVAAWTSGPNRLTVECLPDDKVRWIVSRAIGDEIERAAGSGRIDRLRDVLQPYDPAVWFEYAE